MALYEQLSVDAHSEATLASQIKRQIIWLIASQKLKPGERLPSIQALARHLGINLHTVRSAYQKLELDGLVETRRGRGTIVLDFDPQRLAGDGKALRSHTVGVILPSWSNPFYHQFLQGVEEIADQDHTLLMLCNTHDDPNTAWWDYARLVSRQVDGVLVVSHDICAYLGDDLPADPPSPKTAVPFVTVDWPGCAGYSVEIDLQGVGYKATEHLLAHGHSRVGLITYQVDVANTKPILDGYRQALQARGLSFDAQLVARVAAFDRAAGAQGARSLFSLPEPPSAIFAAADMLALGALEAARETGLRVPEDIALVGFNDIPLAALVEPRLTSAAVPANEMGRAAMKMLSALIAGRRPTNRRLVFEPTLAVRESCGGNCLP